MSAQDSITVVQGFIDTVLNGGDLSGLERYWTEDMVWRGGSLGEYHGLADFRKFAEANAAGAFTGMHLEPQRFLTDGDTVVALFTNSGVNTGPFMGMPATDKPAKWNGVGIYRIHDGKIAEATFVEDILAMLLQLGITSLPSAF
ncbi:ester cyclase [Streptomyces prunicolor]|uniref:ester cyclase n=1 Tax=Streptomyces prunicolor TaxID=67348 RepID=UPI002254C1FA|nr:ester cyclase [Streptomyces prunicolor]MCX5235248.1 ester cyclase [Streptomyces prunicolor]